MSSSSSTGSGKRSPARKATSPARKATSPARKATSPARKTTGRRHMGGPLLGSSAVVAHPPALPLPPRRHHAPHSSQQSQDQVSGSDKTGRNRRKLNHSLASTPGSDETVL